MKNLIIIIGIFTVTSGPALAQENLPTYHFGSDYKVDTIYNTKPLPTYHFGNDYKVDTIYKFGGFDIKPLPIYNFGNNGSHIEHPIEEFGQSNQANVKPPYIFGELVVSCPTNKGYMTMTTSNMKLWVLQNGDCHLSYTVETHLGRVGSGCTGVAGGQISLIFLDKNLNLLYRINQAIWFDTGTSYPDNTIHDNEVARIYPIIGNVRIEVRLEPKVANCPEHHSFPTPRWPF